MYEDRSPGHQRVLRMLDPTRGRGLEIGPLFDPIVHRSDGDIRYVDLYPAEKLREEYANHPLVPADQIVDPDFVIIGPDGPEPLPQVVRGADPFDWVVASHVIEHVPDLIGWLGQVADIVTDDGRLMLVVPDRRCCFDALRPPTTVGEVLLARYHRDTMPSVRAVYDHFSRAVAIESAAAWSGYRPTDADRIHTPDFVTDQLRIAEEAKHYIDCHVWLFTPQEFLDQMAELASLGLIDFVVETIEPTPRNELEFYVSLRRIPRGVSDEERSSRASKSVVEVNDRFVRSIATEAELAQDAHQTMLPLSDKEIRLIESKRATLQRVRSSAARIRRILRIPG